MKSSDNAAYIRIKSTNRPAAKLYSIIPIRSVNKGGYSSASMINNHGQIVGHASEETKTPTRAFAWSNEYGLIPDLGSIYGGNSFATNINDSGVIVGYTSTPENSLRGFLLGQGQMFDLGLLSSVDFDEAFSVATDINESGQIVGYSHNAENRVHGFIWDHQQGMTDLGSFGDGQSYAYSVNDAGVAVGWSQIASKAAFRAFKWSAGNGMEEIEAPEEIPTVAYAISNQGLICGASATGTLLNQLQACLWNGGVKRFLGTISGFSFSACHSLNEIGQVVGWAYPTRHCEMKFGRAFIWDETRGIQDLNFLIAAEPEWILHKALGINNEGDIVGCGTVDGKMQAFLMTPIDYARDVTRLIRFQQLNLITNQKSGVVYRTIIVKNISHKPIFGPLNLVFRELSPWIKVLGAGGEYDDSQFRTVKVDALAPGSSISTTVQFNNPNNLLIYYNCECYAGSF